MRSFYIHDLINEGIEIKRRMRNKPESKTQQEIVAEYLVEPEPVLEDVKTERKGFRVPYHPEYVPYAKSGEFTSEGTYLRSHKYNVDEVLALRHDGTFQENQRYLPTKVQVPADQLIEAVTFASEEEMVPKRLEQESFANDDFWREDLLEDETGQKHYSKTTSEYFQHREILKFKVAIQRENAIDDKIAQMLLQEQAAAAAENTTRSANQAGGFSQEQ